MPLHTEFWILTPSRLSRFNATPQSIRGVAHDAEQTLRSRALPDIDDFDMRKACLSAALLCVASAAASPDEVAFFGLRRLQAKQNLKLVLTMPTMTQRSGDCCILPYRLLFC